MFFSLWLYSYLLYSCGFSLAMEIVSDEKNAPDLLCPRGDSSCQFLSEIVELRKEVNSLTELVRTDALTGLFNFRFFNETIALEMERTRRGTQPLSMILLDVDHFKKFNDQWGHELGNHALVHIANLIKIAVRKLDLACRFGGEEFVILLPNTDLRQAANVAERLREMIASTPVEISGQAPIAITASVGVDQFTSFNTETSEAFVHRVDSWLYKAKHNGRNQVAYPDLMTKTQKESVTPEEKDALFNLLNVDN
jgi:diguanylate cyclase (GGDEF)-like protein